MIQVPPFVLQCGRCKSIIGDSSTYIHFYNDPLNSIILEKTINVKRLSDISTSKFGLESMTYHILQCNICGKTIGKFYVSIPSSSSSFSSSSPIYEYALNNYSLSINDILYYQIGQSLLQYGKKKQSLVDFLKNSTRYRMPEISSAIATPGEIPMINDRNITSNNSSSSSSNDGDDMSTSLLTVNNEIDKIQYVLLSVLTRLEALENNHKNNSSNNNDNNNISNNNNHNNNSSNINDNKNHSNNNISNNNDCNNHSSNSYNDNNNHGDNDHNNNNGNNNNKKVKNNHHTYNYNDNYDSNINSISHDNTCIYTDPNPSSSSSSSVVDSSSSSSTVAAAVVDS